MNLTVLIALSLGFIFVLLNKKKFMNTQNSREFNAFQFQNKIIEVIGISLLILLWSMSLYYYKELPETIPIHFNGLGEADGYGSKKTIFMLPIIATMLYFFLFYLSRSPETFNYSVKITPENKEQQYNNAVRLMKIMSVVIVIIFLIIDYSTIKTALNKENNIGFYTLPLVLSIIFVPIIYYIYKSFKLK
jgi:uncharacterized membrane protein